MTVPWSTYGRCHSCGAQLRRRCRHPNGDGKNEPCVGRAKRLGVVVVVHSTDAQAAARKRTSDKLDATLVALDTLRKEARAREKRMRQLEAALTDRDEEIADLKLQLREERSRLIAIAELIK